MKWRRNMCSRVDAPHSSKRSWRPMNFWTAKHSWQTVLSPIGIYGAMLVMLVGAAIWLAFDLVAGRAQIIQERSALAVQQSQFMSQWLGTTIVAADYVLRDVLEKVPPEKVNSSVGNEDEIQRVCPWLAKKCRPCPEPLALASMMKSVFTGWWQTPAR